MKVDVDTKDELIRAAHNPVLFKEIVEYIDREYGSPGIIFKSTSKMSMLAYQLVDYKNTSYDGMWPQIAIAPQQKSINIYVFALKGDHYLLEEYQEIFGISNIGKSCLRIRKMNKRRYKALKEIIAYIKENPL